MAALTWAAASYTTTRGTTAPTPGRNRLRPYSMRMPARWASAA